MTDPGDLQIVKSVIQRQPMPDAGDTIGLLFHPAMIGTRYDQTPVNSVTFASTGGDGVHYGFLVDSHLPDNASPVVMTVPMADQPNRVVGRNLRHFLGLGRRAGYFALEQLQYDFAETVRELDGGLVQPDEPEGQALLDDLAAALSVVGWTDHGAELARLEAEFAGKLIVQPYD